MTNSPHVIASAHVALAALLLGTPAAWAQTSEDTPLLANPSAIEFTIDAQTAPPPSSAFRVELFRAGDDTATAKPVRQVDTRNATVQGGLVRIELANALRDVEDGEYVARLRAVSPIGISSVGSATVPFVVYGHGTDGRARSATVLSTEPSEAERRQEQFWTRVAVAIAAGVLLVPMLLR
jgi:hypothetical protein